MDVPDELGARRRRYKFGLDARRERSVEDAQRSASTELGSMGRKTDDRIVTIIQVG